MSSPLSVTLWRSKILEPDVTYRGGGGGGSPPVFTVKVTLQKTNRLILSDDTVTVLPDNENPLRSSGTLSIDPYAHNESSWHQSLRLEIRSLLSRVDTMFEDSILDKLARKVDEMIEVHHCHVHLTVAIEIIHDIYQSLDNDNDDEEAEIRRSLQRVQAEDYMEVDGEEEEEDKCGICLGDMLLNKNKSINQDGVEEEVVSLPCQHVFHGTCVVKWLKIKPFCPLCRFKLPVAATKPQRRRWRTILLSREVTRRVLFLALVQKYGYIDYR